VGSIARENKNKNKNVYLEYNVSHFGIKPSGKYVKIQILSAALIFGLHVFSTSSLFRTGFIN